MTESQPGPPREIAKAIAEAMGDPLRSQVAYVISAAPGLTVREIADRISEPPRRVRHQLSILRQAGLVEVSDQGTRRGAVENRYSMTHSLFISDEEEDALPTHLRRRIAIEVVRRVFADVAAATGEGTFGLRAGNHLSQLFGQVDDAGWEALVKLSNRYLEEAQQVIEEAKQRTGENDMEAFPITTSLFLFEGPERPPAQPSD